jgi:hypothetical protein
MLCLVGLLNCLAAKRKIAVGAVVTVVKPEQFLRRLFQTVRGNRSEPGAEGHLYRFPQLWPFPQRFAPRGFPLVQRFLFQKKKAPGCPLEPKTRVINRLCSGANQ